MHQRRLCIWGILLYLLVQTSMAGGTVCSRKQIEVTDSTTITIYFKVNESVINASYMGNEEQLRALKALISTDNLSQITSLVIRATASPEGHVFWNKTLATQRATAVEELFRTFFPNNNIFIDSKTSIAYDWKNVKSTFEHDLHIPYRDQLLAIIDDPRLNDATKESKIRRLGNGVTYNYLKANVLNHLRTGAVTVTIHHTVTKEPVLQTDTLPPPRITEELSETNQVIIPIRKRMTVALKSNLLFDLVGAPNIGVELPVGKRFSIGATAAYAYWRISNLYALQTIQGSLESKYWFNASKRPLTGWSAGIYGTYCSRYDVQWKDGYQGDGFWSAGASVGYSIPISSILNMEFAIAGGYLYTPEVRSYTRPEKGHLMWKETRYNVGKVTLTKLQINLIWFIGQKKKGGIK